MRPVARFWGVLPLLAALALPGGAAAQPRYGPAPYGPPPGRAYGPGGFVEGVVSADNGRCMVLQDRQRRSFYLQGDTRGLRPGDQVTLRERTLNRSSCGGDGPTLEVLEVRTVWTNGAHRSAYFDSRRDGTFDRFVLRSRDRGGWYADRYSYMQQGGDGSGRYGDQQPGDRYAPNGPYGPPPDQRGQRSYPSQPGQPPYDRTQPQYEDPNSQYDPNGQSDANGQPPVDQGYDQNGDDRGAGSQPVSVDGTLNFNGPCPAVRDSGGASYDLAGDLRGFHNGDRVRVTGVLSGSSSCGGTALEIREIRQRR